MDLGAVLIVKNEAQVIERCLTSARAAGVKTFTVVDTGSTDQTWDILERQPDVNYGRLPWVNFGHNRSEAFALARGTADWLLALDADMTVEIDPDFIPDPNIDAYLIEMQNGGLTYRLPLLLRGDLPWISVGSVHEYTVLQDLSFGRREPTDKVRITHHGEGRGSIEKTRWHAEMLEAELVREPENPRTVFYLAQTYRELGDSRAQGMYQLRARIGGWEEERWYASYQAALSPFDALALLACWEARPHRLEPLHALVSELNRRDMHHAAYRLSGGVSGPCGDILFVEPSVWDWGMAFERSIAAWWVGDMPEFHRLSEELLNNPRLPEPEREAVFRNLALKVA